MAGRKTELMRVDAEMAECLRWLARHEHATAEKAGRKPKSAARILKDLAGQRVTNAFGRIEPWVKTVRAAMARTTNTEGRA